MVSAGIMATALGAPLGDVLKWLVWKVIATAREGLSQAWGYVGVLLNVTPGVQTEPNPHANGIGNDEESGVIEIVPVKADGNTVR